MRHQLISVLLFSLLSALAGASFADELADAERQLAEKRYPEAVRTYTKLADGGNAVAQLRLGELYWYGEGVALDRAKGDALFAKAAAQGNKEAIAATALSGQRTARSKELAYWSSAYDGADLKRGQYDCKVPEVPAVSKTKKEIAAVSATLDAYTVCYNGFVDHAAAAMPPGKAIPDDLVVLMSEQELVAARAGIATVFERVVAQARADADKLQLQRSNWLAATETYVKNANAIQEATKRMELQYRENDYVRTQKGATVRK